VVLARAKVALQLTLGAAIVLVGLDQHALVGVLALVAIGSAVGLPALLSLLPKGTLRAAPVLPAIVAARLLVNWLFFGTEAFIPLALTAVRGKTTLFAGLMLTTSAIAWSSAAWVQAKLADPRRDALMIGGGIAGVGLGATIVATTLWASVPIAAAFIGWAIGGVGMGFAFNTSSVAALREAPEGQEGATSSSLQLADALGVSLSAGLGGAVVAAGDRGAWSAAPTLAIVFAITGVAVVPGVLAARRLRPGSRP
jgi:hypothetical protein